MEQYTNFAKVYDLFMDNVPYDKWVERIRDILHKENIFDGLICDLGCGTGAITERLANIGYDMIGIDNSYDMLDIAMEKKYASGNDILYLCQDMREFELYGTVRAIVSGCDSLNYIQDLSGLEEVFSLVNNYLDPGGLFIFDMNTVYDLNLFIKLENDIYKRFEERHVQRAYTFDEIVSAINSSNMQLEKYLDADTYGDLRENTERILFIAREKGK